MRIQGKLVATLLKMPDFGFDDLPPEIRALAARDLWDLVETDLKYQGYVQRQIGQNEKLSRDHVRVIPGNIDYHQIRGLRPETREKLAMVRPDSIGMASRVSGVTPADLSIISIWLEKNRLQQS
jgi:tRNA uridine 5-carboxymethylaminomethyl modification enzyme